MSEPTRYEIEIRGRASHRVLRPVIDDFTIDTTATGNTLLTGPVRDTSQLSGILAHFTSLNIDVVCLAAVDQAWGHAWGHAWGLTPGVIEHTSIPTDHPNPEGITP